jgi:hypothetical protein
MSIGHLKLEGSARPSAPALCPVDLQIERVSGDETSAPPSIPYKQKRPPGTATVLIYGKQ